MTKSPRRNVSDVGIELGAACMPGGHASDRATAPGNKVIYISVKTILSQTAILLGSQGHN